MIPFFLIWGKYFYKVFKIEKEPVQIKFARPLNQEERQQTKDELENYKNLNKKLISSTLTFVGSLLIFYFGLVKTGADMTGKPVFQALFLVLIAACFISLVLTVYFIYKLDRVIALNKDLKDGIMRIEGKLFVTNMQVNQVNRTQVNQFEMILLRMGKYSFPIDKKFAVGISQGDRYAIEYSSGTKHVWKIEKLTGDPIG